MKHEKNKRLTIITFDLVYNIISYVDERVVEKQDVIQQRYSWCIK